MTSRPKKIETYFERFARRIRLVAVPFSILSVALLVLLGNTGTTISYFSDNEPSRVNEFAAGLLDFTVSPSDMVEFFIGPENGGDETLVPVFTPISGSFDTRYRVFAQKQSGQVAFCNALLASATTSPIVYGGQLLSLSTGDTTTSGPWPLSLSLTSLLGVSHNDVCYVDLIYRGWRDGASEGEGYVDEERVRLSLRPRTIVLNEFLPNPEGVAYGFDFGTDSSNMPQGEWVELFNNSGSPRNLSGWYIWDASGFEANKIYITASSTNSGSTVIPSGGWLVVYMNKAVLNNGGDDVRLYNPSNVLVDSFAYANHDVCSYEPTPGDPNSVSGSGTECDPVPPNKSYARIPDGLGAWLDPVPTPGFANSENSELIIPAVASTTATSSPFVLEETVTNSGEIAVSASTTQEVSAEVVENASSTPEILPDENSATSTEATLPEAENTEGGTTATEESVPTAPVESADTSLEAVSEVPQETEVAPSEPAPAEVPIETFPQTEIQEETAPEVPQEEAVVTPEPEPAPVVEAQTEAPPATE